MGKHPPTIRMFSKYERRTDTRSHGDRKKLYEGGAEVLRAEWLESTWKEKFAEFSKRPAKKLPKWFGVRPGKKAGDPETPEGEEEAAEGDHREHQDRRVPRSLDRRPHLALRAPHACAPLWPRALLWHLRASCARAGQKLTSEEEQVCRASTSATRDRPTGECMGTLWQRRFLRGNIPRVACAFEFALASADDRALPPSSSSFLSSWCGAPFVPPFLACPFFRLLGQT